MTFTAFSLAGLLLILGLVTYNWLRTRPEQGSFAQKLRSLLAAPVFEDDEMTRVAGLLHTTLNAIFVVVAVMLAVTAFLSIENDLLIGLTLISIVLGLDLLVRRGHVRLASVLLPSALLVVITAAISNLGHLRSAVTGGYLVVIVIAGLLLGGRGALIFCLLSILALFGLLVVEAGGVLDPRSETAGRLLREWIVDTGVFGITALLLYLTARSIRAGLENARRLRRVEEKRVGELDALLTTERKRARQMELLAGVAHQLASLNDPQALMDEVVRRLHTDFGFDHAALFLVEGGELVLHAIIGLSSEVVSPGERVHLGHGIVGWVAQTGQTYLSNDVSTDEHFVALPGNRTAAEVAVPLRLGKTVIGVLNVESARAGAFDATDVRTLDSLADLVATGLQSSQLFAELRHREQLAEALRRVGAAVTASLNLPTVLDTICAEARHVFDADGAAVWLLEARLLHAVAACGPDSENVLHQRVHLDDPASIVARAAREGRPICVNDLQPSAGGLPQLKYSPNAQSLLAMPILKEGQTSGVLVIVDEHRSQHFGTQEVAAAGLLSAQLAVAIHNARLYEDRQRRAEQLALLNDITHASLETADFQQMLQTLADRLGELIGADGCYLTLWDEAQQRTLPAAAYGELREVYPATQSEPGEKTMTESVLRAGHPLVAEDVFHSPYLDPHIAAQFPTRSMLALPLIAGDQKLGAALIGFDQSHHFTPDEIALGEQAARQIALAMARVRALEAERKRSAELETLRQASLHLTSHLETQSVLQTILEHALRLVTASNAAIFLYDGERLTFGAALGPDGYSQKPYAQPRPQGLTYTVARSGARVVVPDVSRHPLYQDWQWGGGIAGLPLCLGGQVRGVMNIAFAEPHAFDDNELRILGLLADQAAVALEHAWLFETERAEHALAEALHEVGTALSASLDVESVLDRVLDQIGRVVPYDAANVMLIDEAGRTHLVRQRGYEQFGREVADGMRSVRLEIATTANLRWMAETGQPLVIPDTQMNPDWVKVKASAYIRSWAGAPIVSQGKVIAFFSLDKVEPGFYQPKHAKHLAAFAGQAALALQNAHLFEAERRRAQMLAALHATSLDITLPHDLPTLLQTIVERAVRLLGAADGGLDLCDPERQEVRCVYDTVSGYMGTVVRYGEGAAGLAAQAGEPLIVDDYRTWPHRAPDFDIQQGFFISIVAVPMIWQGQVTGVIDVRHNVEGRRFSPSDVELLTQFASQAAIAVENARLHAAAKERARELDALLTANAALLSTLELDPLLDNVLTAAIAAIPAAEKGSILLVDRTTQQLQIRAMSGYADARARSLDFARNEGYAAKAVREQQPLLIPDARADPAICYQGDIAEVRGILSAIVAPFMLQSQEAFEPQAIGAITLDATRRAAFTEADLHLLVAFAHTAAVAIDHARLHAEVQALAVTDGLTGLANHRAFDHALRTEVARAARYGHPLSLIFLDIDAFKQYNDTYGHPAGNVRLKAIADLLRANVRDPDVAARYGGEEFALILPHTHKAGALSLAERIRAAAEAAAPFQATHGRPVSGYTLSLGVSSLPEDAHDAETLLLLADNAELESKRAGKNCVSAAPALRSVIPEN